MRILTGRDVNFILLKKNEQENDKFTFLIK
jgi:hypothetical protein